MKIGRSAPYFLPSGGEAGGGGGLDAAIFFAPEHTHEEVGENYSCSSNREIAIWSVLRVILEEREGVRGIFTQLKIKLR